MYCLEAANLVTQGRGSKIGTANANGFRGRKICTCPLLLRFWGPIHIYSLGRGEFGGAEFSFQVSWTAPQVFARLNSSRLSRRFMSSGKIFLHLFYCGNGVSSCMEAEK